MTEARGFFLHLYLFFWMCQGACIVHTRSPRTSQLHSMRRLGTRRRWRRGMQQPSQGSNRSTCLQVRVPSLTIMLLIIRPFIPFHSIPLSRFIGRDNDSEYARLHSRLCPANSRSNTVRRPTSNTLQSQYQYFRLSAAIRLRCLQAFAEARAAWRPLSAPISQV
jgi:hypothetical protein